MSVSRWKIVCLLLCAALATPATAEDDVVPFGSDWLYYLPTTVAEQPSGSFESKWFQADFDTTSPQWTGPSPGPFQYGGIRAFDPSRDDVIRPFATELMPPDRDTDLRYTTYFRHQFTTNSDSSGVGVDILAHDGAKVFLDGEQVLNLRCCNVDGEPRLEDEPDEYFGLASANGNERAYERFFLPDSLSAGDHTLAVAVHPMRNNSTDLGFSMRLFGGADTLVEPGGTWNYFEGTEEASDGTLDWTTVGFDDAGWEKGAEGIGYDEDLDVNVLDLIETELTDMQDIYRSVYLRQDFTVGADAEIGELVLSIDHDDSFFAYVNGQYVGSNMTRHPFRDDTSQPVPFDFDGTITSHESTNADGGTGDVYTFPIPSNLLNVGDENVLALHGFNTTLDSSDFFVGQVKLIGLAGSGPALPGDFDGSGVLDLADINALSNEIASGGSDPLFDVTGDGQVTIDDHTMWVGTLKNTYSGDANLDGEFNSGDLVAIFRGGKFEQDVDASWEEGDWTADRRVGSSDLVAAFREGGFELGPKAARAVPEPSGILLVLLGACCLMGRRRR